MPKVKHPDRYAEAIKVAVEGALTAEILVPFDMPRLAKQFRNSVHDYIAANRQHETELAKKLTSISCRVYSTHDVQGMRPDYNPGPDYPYTLVMDFREPFVEQIADMRAHDGPKMSLPVSNISPEERRGPDLDDDPDEEREVNFNHIIGNL